MMAKQLAVLTLGIAAAAGSTTASAAPADGHGIRRCELRVNAEEPHAPARRIITADLDRNKVYDAGTEYDNEVAARTLPDLGYEVMVADDAMIWGAHNTRTGRTYYRYTLNFHSGQVSLQTEGHEELIGTCIQPIG